MPLLFIAIVLFIAFTIGLNLGLHGVILVQHQTHPKSSLNPSLDSISDISVDIPSVLDNDHQNQAIQTGETPPPPPTIVQKKPIVVPSEVVSSSFSLSQMQKRLFGQLQSSAENKPAEGADHPAEEPASPDSEGKKTPDSNSEKEEPAPPSPLDTLQKKIHDLENAVIHESTFKTPPKTNPFLHTPLVLLTCCRPQLLIKTLESLFKVRGVDSTNLLIVQDGNAPEISKIANEHHIKLIQNTGAAGLRGSLDGAAKIAKHYKYALTAAFDYFDKANAIIIIEDDLLFSPDFYEYLTNTAMILLEDPSSFVVSAWNDNGFINKVYEPYGIRRTEFFPGLGWLLTRKLYKTELEKKWPNEHWDHWLRSPEIHQFRETIYPQVPRTYHNGIKGTFMDVSTHNRYFRDIAYNQDTAVVWPSSPSSSSSSSSLISSSVLPDSNQLSFTNYQKGGYIYNEKRIQQLIHQCHHLTSIEELVKLSGEIICIWISVPIIEQPFTKVSNFFGIWHEHHRGNHRGLHEFYFYSNYILLINIDASLLTTSHQEHLAHQHYTQIKEFKSNHFDYFMYKQFKPSNIPLISTDSFHQNYLIRIQEKYSSLGILPNRKKVQIKNIYAATNTDTSCNEVCQMQGKDCDGEHLSDINHCDYLKKYFPCKQCKESMGPEQPVYVDPLSPKELFPGVCLYNQDPMQMPILCHAKHPNTLRLCLCK